MSDYNPNSIDVKLATIIAQLDTHVKVEETHHMEIVDRFKSQDTTMMSIDERVKKLENIKAKAMGAAAVAGVTGGGVLHGLLKLFSGGGGGTGTH